MRSMIRVALAAVVLLAPLAYAASRRPGQEAPKVDVSNLNGTLWAEGWCAGNDGSIKSKGTYDTKVNTQTKDVTERLEIYLVLSVTVEQSGARRLVGGTAWGEINVIEKEGLAGTEDPAKPFSEPLEYSLMGYWTDPNDARINDFDHAKETAAEEIAEKNGGGDVVGTFVHNSYSRALTAKVTIVLKGQARTGPGVEDTISDKATLTFKKENGDSIKTKQVGKDN